MCSTSRFNRSRPRPDATPLAARRPATFSLLVLLAASAAFAAARPAAEQAKIEFLLGEVRTSPDVFVRNGQEYDGKKAASHMKGKLFFAGKRVQTARDFIIGIASHSEESGKPYTVRHGAGTAEPLGDWLARRLEGYERSHAPPSR